ncbi:U32 family peptidase [Candidatus Woesearchaeota archaeon]|nr:U32 family peptidase [Candidatus Woesearchaeota archaeon]
MKKIELLLPAGNEECLRAAVHNGADAVYLGLQNFNARRSADNFGAHNIFSAIDFCHKRKVKVYVTFNTLIKNNEIEDALNQINLAHSAGADAVIIQDPCLIPLIKANFSQLPIHLSTQATTSNSYSVPDCVERVILARELLLEEIKTISDNGKKQGYETEVFVHGALCLSYSGQCLFSSMVGGRSGNRGRCAQPCRRIYNNKYLLSTMDLCLLSKIPDLIATGAASLKIEGRMRTPLYVATVARIYRKYIDAYYAGTFNAFTGYKARFTEDKASFIEDKTKIIEDKKTKVIENKTSFEKDMDELMLAFNREFTTGFAFNDSIVDTRKPMNRGLFIGVIKNGRIKLKKALKIGDGIAIWKDDKVIGFTVSKIKIVAKSKEDNVGEAIDIQEASEGETIQIDTKGAGRSAEEEIREEAEDTAEPSYPVYKTSSVDMRLELGDEILLIKPKIIDRKLIIPTIPKRDNEDEVKLFCKVYDKTSAIDADKEKADIIYYDILKNDCSDVKKLIKNSKFFVYTPRILSDKQINDIIEKLKHIKPDGVLVGNRGLLKAIKEDMPEYGYGTLHLDYSFNCFNEIDVNYYVNAQACIPIISSELNFSEISLLKNKNFIVLAHGNIVLMTTKQRLKAPELVDEEGRSFKVRQNHSNPCVYEILNAQQIGLFNKSLDCLKQGIKYFYIDTNKDVDKFIRIYRKILNGEQFDDTKIKKGYTTGHFSRGVE